MKFLENNWRGLTMLALGLGTVLIGAFVLHVCADEGHFMTTANGMNVDMACTWSRRAVIGLGGLIGLTGLVMLWMREAARALSLVAMVAGGLIIATPLWLIPTCAKAMMTCNMSFKPGALILGGLTVLMGLVGALKFARSETRTERTALHA